MKKSDRTKIEAAKAALPLPDLLHKLGFQPPAGGEGNMPSPFVHGNPQKTPSFSIFKLGDAWGWCDRTGGGEIKGDEITLLEKLEGLSPGAAIARYLALAGVENGLPGPGVRKDHGKLKVAGAVKAKPSYVVDWPGAVSKFTADHCASLAKWRGYPVEFVEWLRDQGLVGLCKGLTAFPVHNEHGEIVSAHIRPEKRNWFFAPTLRELRTSGKLEKAFPYFFIGDVLQAKKTLLFESQWDAFAVMASMEWHKGAPAGWVVLITRGASNGKNASKAFGDVYAWPQNDPLVKGERAGDKWMRQVVECAPGDLFQVETPMKFKDVNDWTKAEKLDAWGAIERAPKVERAQANVKSNVVPFPAGSSGASVAQSPVANGSESQPPFDAGTVLDEMQLYWLDGSSSYFLRPLKNGRDRFQEMGAVEIRRKLRVRGFRDRRDAEAGEKASEIDKILDQVTEQRAVDFAVNIAGTKAGVYEIAGRRLLVRESPKLIEPVPGDHFETIDAFLLALLGAEGEVHFCSWLKIAYEALRAGERRPGQAMIIIGPPDCGKSRIQHQIITPILAARSADPKSSFFNKTDFNAELVGAEHLLIEEIPSSNRHEERQYFGEKIKEVVANDTARLHKKNRDAVTVSPFWRLSITLNDNIEKLRCLPPLTDDLAEKIIMLEARHAPEFWARFADVPDPRKAFRDAIEKELPAFADYLVKMTITEKMKGRRYGVKSYIPEKIAEMIFESEPESHLLLLIDKEIFRPGRLQSSAETDAHGAAELEPGEAAATAAAGGAIEPWRGDAEDLKQALCSDSSVVRVSANRLLGAHPVAIGQYLARLASKFPARFQRHRTASKRAWIINPPSS